MIAGFLEKKATVYSPNGFNSYMQEIYDSNSDLCRSEFSHIVFLVDLTEIQHKSDWQQEIDSIFACISFAKQRFSKSNFVVSNCTILRDSIFVSGQHSVQQEVENYFNNSLKNITGDVLTLDLLSLATSMGHDQFFSKKMWYGGSIPYSIKASSAIAEQIFKLCATRVRKKVFALDLDNTLWGGVIGEDGLDGIVIGDSKEGAIYQDLQRRILEIKNTGIILVIISKNNPEDALLPFKEKYGMVLTLDDFACIKANWDSKAQNIRQAASELNVGLDSFVFLDDNPVEQEAVRLELPEVTVLDFPLDKAKLADCATRAYNDYFWTSKISKEDAIRTDSYKQNAKRESLAQTIGSLEDYLKTLEMKTVVGLANELELARIVELTNKTNQFNLTTKRVTNESVKTYLASGNQIYVAYNSDKFGDNGLIAICYVAIDGTTARIDNFLMSCRVMNRTIETGIFNLLEQNLLFRGIKTVYLDYEKSLKNAPVKSLPMLLGYKQVAGDDYKSEYKITLNKKTSSRIEFSNATLRKG